MENIISSKHNNPNRERQSSFCNLPLSLAKQGEEVTVEAVKGKDETRSFLAGLGFVEGAKVSVVSEMGGNVIVCVKDSRVAISRSMAARIITRA